VFAISEGEGRFKRHIDNAAFIAPSGGVCAKPVK
jgi:hypothetical protein